MADTVLWLRRVQELEELLRVQDQEIIAVKKRNEAIQLHADQVRMAHHLEGRRTLQQSRQHRYVVR